MILTRLTLNLTSETSSLQSSTVFMSLEATIADQLPSVLPTLLQQLALKGLPRSVSWMSQSVSHTYTLFRLVINTILFVSLLIKTDGQLKPSFKANSFRPVMLRSWSVSLFHRMRSPVVKMPQKCRPSSDVL